MSKSLENIIVATFYGTLFLIGWHIGAELLAAL